MDLYLLIYLEFSGIYLFCCGLLDVSLLAYYHGSELGDAKERNDKTKSENTGRHAGINMRNVILILHYSILYTSIFYVLYHTSLLYFRYSAPYYLYFPHYTYYQNIVSLQYYALLILLLLGSLSL